MKTAARLADRFPGVNPMDVLRADNIEWQLWKAFAACHDADLAAASARADTRGR